MIQAIDTALQKLSVYDGIVVRGIDSRGLIDKNKFLVAHQKGNVVQYMGYTSTDKSKPYPGDIVLNIENKNGRHIGSFSIDKNENEILMPRSSLFEIIDVAIRDGKLYIEMKEISSEEIRGRKMAQFSSGGTHGKD